MLIKHGWIFLMAMTVINGFVFRYRSRKYISANPELRPGYRRIFLGWMFWANLPWLIMAIGSLTNATQSIFDFSDLRSQNPVVIVFYISMLAIAVLGTRWIFFKGGADCLAKHPGLIQFQILTISYDVKSPGTIKVLWTLFLIAFIAGIIINYTLVLTPARMG